MTVALWRAVCCILVVLLVAQNLLLWRSSKKVYQPAHLVESHSDQAHDKVPASWIFDHTRDANNIALSNAQCGLAFPDLYDEIDRAASVRQGWFKEITEDDISISWRGDGAIRALIHENQLRVLESKGAVGPAYRYRTISSLQQLQRALLGATAASEKLPTIEFALTVDDISLIPNGESTHAIWGFARRLIDHDQERVWLMPDFNFWSWPDVAGSYNEMRERAAQHNAFISEKTQRAAWRGVVWTNEWIRKPLMELQNESWADIEEVDWKTKANMMPIEDFCRYGYIVHTEGRSWSGRLKYALLCDSVSIIHDLDWQSHYYHLLVPDGPHQNHVPVKRDFSDLGKKVKKLLANPDDAQRIADNAVKQFRDRYLTPAAEACYWRRLVMGWSEVAFQPEPWETVEVNVSGTQRLEKRLRGVSFEEFMLMETEYPPPPPAPTEDGELPL